MPTANLNQKSPPDRTPHRIDLIDEKRTCAEHMFAWRHMIGNVVDIAAEPSEIGRFAGDVTALATERVVLSRIASSSIRLLRSQDTVFANPLDQFGIMLVMAGSMAGAVSSELTLGPGDVLVLDLLQTFSLQTSLDGGLTEGITLWIPRSRLLSSVSNEHALHGLVLRGTSPAGRLVGGSLQTLMTEAPCMSAAELETLADGVIELAARALAPALNLAAGSGAAVPLASFVTIRRYVDRHLMSPALNANMIANNFGLSRASLYRLFEPVGGVASYIRKARLQHAYQHITMSELSDRRIGQIAHGLGFKNITTFNRMFRKLYGLNPSEARRKSAHDQPSIILRTSADSTRTLAECLRRLSQP